MSRHRQQAVFHIEPDLLFSSIELSVVLNLTRKDTTLRIPVKMNARSGNK